MDILKLKQDLKDELADILERSQFVEKQKQAREAAVDRLTRAEAIAIAATLHELLGWLPSVKVETSKQSAATAVSVSASVTGDDVISTSGLVVLSDDLMTTEFEVLTQAEYVLLDDFTGDAQKVETREALVRAIFDAFTSSYRRRYEFALTEAGLRSKVLLDGEQINLLSQPQ
ncbi:MAG: hypothetical protein HN715_01380 [Rhodobiaceae bacterium]|nr:hypothetical protein [Rhodobiaceae bacterium]